MSLKMLVSTLLTAMFKFKEINVSVQ